MSGEKVERVILQDAVSTAVEIIASQLGSDGVTLETQKVDVRRFTRLNKVEIVSIAYFLRHQNKWIKEFMSDYMNLKMSDEEDPRYRNIVEALKNITRPPESRPPKDKRSFIQKHFTQRGQEPE